MFIFYRVVTAVIIWFVSRFARIFMIFPVLNLVGFSISILQCISLWFFCSSFFLLFHWNEALFAKPNPNSFYFKNQLEHICLSWKVLFIHTQRQRVGNRIATGKVFLQIVFRSLYFSILKLHVLIQFLCWFPFFVRKSGCLGISFNSK